MSMFTHLFIASNDVEAACRFYDATMPLLGHSAKALPEGGVYEGAGCRYIVLKPFNKEPTAPANGNVIAFAAPDYAAVEAWYAAGLAAGGKDFSAPAVRERSPGAMYAAYLYDPTGHLLAAYTANAEAQASSRAAD